MRTSRGQRRRALKAILSTVVLVSAMALASWTTVLAQEPESLELPAAGGTLSFADGAVSLSAPDGTATSAVTISYTPLDATSAPAAAPEGMDFGSRIFSLEVLQDGVADPTFSFRQLVSVTVQYGDADLAGAMGQGTYGTINSQNFREMVLAQRQASAAMKAIIQLGWGKGKAFPPRFL